MQYQNYQPTELVAFKWFFTVTSISMLWGLFSAWVAFKFKIPLDIFMFFDHDLNLTQSLVVGLIYGLVASFVLITLGVLGLYNPILVFVVLLGGFILFLDFILGKSEVTDAKNLIWLMVVPFIMIRDFITHLVIQDQKKRKRKVKEPKFDGTRSQENIF